MAESMTTKTALAKIEDPEDQNLDSNDAYGLCKHIPQLRKECGPQDQMECRRYRYF